MANWCMARVDLWEILKYSIVDFHPDRRDVANWGLVASIANPIRLGRSRPRSRSPKKLVNPAIGPWTNEYVYKILSWRKSA
jgi:hypothetical protein